MTSCSDDGSTDDTESLSDSSDSLDEEIREIERRDNNPFNTMQIPKELEQTKLLEDFYCETESFVIDYLICIEIREY